MQAETKRSLWGRRECEKAENKAGETGRLQKGLERRRKEAEPSVGWRTHVLRLLVWTAGNMTVQNL